VVSLYKIRIMYEFHPIPEAPQIEALMPKKTEEETVYVEAETLEQAAKRAMLFNTISAGGRLVSYYDELGNRVIPEYGSSVQEVVD
jgi:hypothetical protein